MAEGFIVRRGGGAKPMEVISLTFSGISGESLVAPELIGCKSFYIFTDITTPIGDYASYRVHSISYFDGNDICMYVMQIYTGTGFRNEFMQMQNNITFDETTGTITTPHIFNPNVTYTCWAYVEGDE